MKFLHLADLHIGKRLKEYSLIDDQREILRRIEEIARTEEVDGVIVAGDVYDKSIPSVEAVTLFDEFVTSLHRDGKEIFIVGGNHDSSERLSFASELIKESGVHISRRYEGKIDCVRMEKGGEKVDLYLLPFVRPVNVRGYYPEEELETYSDAVACAIEHTSIDPTACNLLITHQFVTGAKESGSEEMTVGGINNVEIDVFAPFDYVALGHIHRRQTLGGGKAHYPGTPIKYSLSEAKEERSVTIVTVEGKSVALKTVPLKPLHDLYEIEGRAEELLQNASDDYVFIVLKDEQEVPGVARELRKKYPNYMNIRYDDRRTKEEDSPLILTKEETPYSLFEKLFERQNNREMTEEQKDYINKMIESVWEMEE